MASRVAEAPPGLDTQEAAEAVASGPFWQLFSRLLTVLLICSCVLALVFVAFTAAQRVFGYQSYTVLSGSMTPTIPVGSLVITHEVPADQIKVGDIITFHPPAEPSILITHRVHAIVEAPNSSGPPVRLFETKGDANATPDDWRVPIAGTPQRYVFHLPVAGYVSSALQTTTARLLLLLVPAVLLCLIVLVELWRPHPAEVATVAAAPGPVTAPKPAIAATAVVTAPAAQASIAAARALRLALRARDIWERPTKVVPVSALFVVVAVLFLLEPTLERVAPAHLLGATIAVAAAVGVWFVASPIVQRAEPTRAATPAQAAPPPVAASTLLIRPELTPVAHSTAPDEPLTERQLKILRLLALGLDQRAISERLALSFETTRNEIQALQRHLGTTSEFETVTRATQSGLI